MGIARQRFLIRRASLFMRPSAFFREITVSRASWQSRVASDNLRGAEIQPFSGFLSLILH